MSALQDLTTDLHMETLKPFQFWKFHIFHAFRALRCTYRSRKVLHDYLFGW